MKSRRATGMALALGLAACGEGKQPLQQPVLATAENPIDYPVSMWDRGFEGETTVLVHVNEHGDVDSTYVEKSSGQQEFDAAAVAGARKLQFTPGRRGEHSIAMWTRLPVRFARDSTATVGNPAPADSVNRP